MDSNMDTLEYVYHFVNIMLDFNDTMEIIVSFKEINPKIYKTEL